jgi:hypothetical protein
MVMISKDDTNMLGEEDYAEVGNLPVWRICWWKFGTGVTGYGEPRFTFKEASDIVKRLNDGHINASHWVQHKDELV